MVVLLAAMLTLRLTWGWYCAKELAAAWDEVRHRQARRLARSRFPGKLPHVDAFIPQLNDARRLAGTLSDGALYIHQQGNDAASIERCWPSCISRVQSATIRRSVRN